LATRIGLRALALPVTVLYALYPTAIYYTNLLATEVPFTFLLLAIVLIWINLMEYRPPPREIPFHRAALVLSLGGLTGVAALVRPVILPIVALFLIFQVRRIRVIQQVLPLLLVSLLAFLGVILPWTYRNYRVLGHLVLISTNGGVNFFIGNNPSATGEYFIPAYNPLVGLEEWEMDQAGWRAGIEFLLKNPFQFLLNYWVKTVKLFSLEWDAFFWNFQTPQTFARQVHSLQIVRQSVSLLPLFVTPLGTSAGLMILGLWGLKKAYALPFRSLIVTLIGVWILVHALFFANPRFHFPLVPLLAISAVHVVHGWLHCRSCSENCLRYWFRQTGLEDYLISLYIGAIIIVWGKVIAERIAVHLL